MCTFEVKVPDSSNYKKKIGNSSIGISIGWHKNSSIGIGMGWNFGIDPSLLRSMKNDLSYKCPEKWWFALLGNEKLWKIDIYKKPFKFMIS